MIIKGVILAGGSGTRLFPLTKIFNKHILPIYNDFMVMYPLHTLIDSGIKDILIVAGKGYAGMFLELLGSGEELGVSLSYTVQEKPAGIADAIRLAKRFVDGDNFVTILSDNIFSDKFDFSNFREGARVYIKEVTNPEMFGVAELDDGGRLIDIVEKPAKPKSNFAITGLYLYDNRVFDIISCLKTSGRGELEITDVNNEYIKMGNLDYEIVRGFWSDAGTFESLYRTTTFIRNNIVNKGVI